MVKRSRKKCTKYGSRGIVKTLINKLPFELHIPGYQFCGPGTHLEKRLNRGDKGINLLNAACCEHDIACSQNKDIEERHKADKILAEAGKKRVIAKDSKFGERAAAATTWAAMTAKRKLGIGICKKRRHKKRKLHIAKRGSFLPLLPLLSVLGSLVDGAASVTTAVNKSKATQKNLEELKRYHNGMFKEHELHIKPYNKGRVLNGSKLKRKRKKRML
ncbi:hypothetical protein KM043_016616 [Ampulex compressa]|nr:hypothetical protein KM043_016616 [Ampulex compressa]